MPAMADRRWTAEEVQNLPEEPGKRFEVVDGELHVSPSPSMRHQVVVGNLHVLVRAYTDRIGGALTLVAPFDIILDVFTLVQPDVLVLPAPNGWRQLDQKALPAPIVAIEVLSPSTARHDRVTKRGRYQRAGVEAWIVDIDAHLVERWLPNEMRPDIITERIVWTPAGASEAFVASLDDVFGDAV